MSNFGDALKAARVDKRYTLREVAKNIGKSIGYLSDIEHNRKQAPELEIVSKIEQFLNVNDGSLVNLANKVRNNRAKRLNWSKRLETDHKLATILYRYEGFTDEEKDELLKKLDEIKEE